MKAEKNSHEAVAKATSLPVSTKMSVEICRSIRGKPLNKVIAHMEDVIDFKRPVEVVKFNWDLGHKPGYGPARYPINTAKAFLSLLKLLKANAENKGLNSDKLIVSFAKADFGPHRWHYGRQRRTRMKDTHIEVRVKELENVNIKGKKTESKTTSKPREKKAQ